ncbi:MAG: helix-turn-helix domain-containing protein [Candidatus Methylomirabilia bacterium]
MGSLGEYFRDLRTAKGLSLQEIAHATRVSRDFLIALEADAYDQLPPPPFTKGFIRAYCQVLGALPDEALQRYRELAREPFTPRPTAPFRPPTSRSRGPLLASLALLAVFGLSFFALTLGFKEEASTPPQPARVEPPAISTAPPSVPSPPVPVLADPVPVPKAPAVFKPADLGGPARLVARTSEPAWIRIQLDDGRVVEELLPAGATRHWTSKRRFILTIGNAGGVSLEFNGRPLPPLGTSGEVIRDLVLPPESQADRS